MKQRFAKWLVLLALLPLNTVIAEPANNVPGWTVDLTLPIHQKPKLHPEFSDPVLGDQAQIVEWAWSPQYAERFGLQPQPDGLPNGGLWLVGVKVQRVQNQQWQRYTCNIVGVMDNTLPIITPPGEISMAYPSNTGLPGKAQVGSVDMKNQVHHEGIQIFTPAQSTLYKNPKNKLEQTRQENGITRKYLHYYRQFQSGLAYFEIEGGCSYFDDPKIFRNEILFPIKVLGENRTAAYESDAIHFDIPNSLMRRIYPYTVDADDWSSCLMRRTGDKSNVLTLRASKSKRFGNICEPVNKQQ